MAEIRLQGLGKNFGRSAILADFNLTVQDQEFLVLVGPSGCGKSTVLPLIAGLEEPSSGDIFLDQYSLNDVLPKDRDLAMVFQSYALYPHMTVAQNLALALRLRGWDAQQINERIGWAAKVLHIEDLLHRKPKQLSGGQRQRVAMGRAIVRKPKAFLFDEPLSNLDAELRVKMRAEMKRLHANLKVTTLYVTHDQVEAMTLADRIVVMKQGSIQQVGAPMEIYAKPANTFVAGFLGSPPMNVWSATVEGNYLNIGGKQVWPLSSGLGDLYPDLNGLKNVWVGVRPEDFRIIEEGQSLSSAALSLTISVSIVEPLGSTVLVDGDLGDHTISVSLTPDHHIFSGDQLLLQADLAKIHCFDGLTGIRLERSNE